MRSSKSRSRSKSSRQRSVGNIVNRVFDSSGPEGKVRGTPQQIIEKYNQLARDAQLANDRVAAENFQQHAEHYARMLSEAQREQDARREQQEQQDRERQQQREQQQRDQRPPQPEAEEQPADVIDLIGDEGDSGLVETPEQKAPPKRRAPRKPKPKAEPVSESADNAASGEGENTPQAPAAE
ncbi:DUF4167 domain-containing protein [Actibacterium sp. MT2.3-13A]|uniref:DUF4167 domain-containing protein n=1 Tax=Actibacterium sp. MT2.3-13A TaxID=2828332 RepID=UPI001BA53B58|nr:DUF4167 domain-containing protein [Actibacterium sp. MT2.3-13A]